MKLDPAGASRSGPLAPEDWTMELIPQGHQFVAQLKRGRTVICRLSISAEGQTEEEAHTELADKARFWIAGYLSRNPSASPGVGGG